MTIYNVTLNVSPDISEEWLAWMRAIHIPEVLESGCFSSARIARLNLPENDGSHTFSVQYTCETMAELHRYQAHFAPKLQAAHNQRYVNKVMAFRTFMEEIETWNL
jgi:quinol monooxygenase YgiN